MTVVATFDAAAWAPTRCEYGLLQLLMCREVLHEDLCKDPPQDRLKALDARLTATPSSHRPRDVPAVARSLSSFDLEERDDDDAESYISEGEPMELSEPVAWGKSQRGAWWRVRGGLREELVVRTGISLQSAELWRAAPGDVFQQKGTPRVLTSGQAQGCIRMPIQPFGWVTADASRAGGPQFLIRTTTPQWRAVYQDVSSGQDIIVRIGIELDSEAIGSFSCGEVVSQAGPSHVVHDGIIRMQVRSALNSKSDHGRIHGWVTVDASSAGGPVFFKLLAEVDGKAANNAKIRRPAAVS
jgi:hypothetical protein